MNPKNSDEFMSHAERLAVVETNMLNITSALSDIKQEMRDMRQDMKHMFEHLDKKIDRLDSRMWAQFFWLMGMSIGLTGLVAHAHYWI